MKDNLDLSTMNDSQIDDLRSHLRDAIAGAKDLGSSFLDVVIADHGSSHASVKTGGPSF